VKEYGAIVISITRMSGLGIAPYGGQIGGDTYSEPVRDLRFQEIEGVVLDRRSYPGIGNLLKAKILKTFSLAIGGYTEKPQLKGPVLQLHERKKMKGGMEVHTIETKV